MANFEKEGFSWLKNSQGTELEIRNGLKGHKKHPNDENSNRLKTEEEVTHIFMKS